VAENTTFRKKAENPKVLHRPVEPAGILVMWGTDIPLGEKPTSQMG
jgi:hypothetical protein